MTRKEILTTFEISRLLSVDISTVIDWIDQKRIQAYRTPGGHRRVKKVDFLAFLKEYNMPVPEAIGNSHKKILIVDDEAGIRRTIRKLIQKNWKDIEIDEAPDGFQAGKKVVDLKPHLVILDLRLPGVDGIQILKEIRRDARLADTRVLVVSAYDSADNKKIIKDAGADGFLPKPFDLNVLKKEIQKLLALS